MQYNNYCEANKKQAKALAASVCLQAFELLPKDEN
jgi:hypothetical protein